VSETKYITIQKKHDRANNIDKILIIWKCCAIYKISALTWYGLVVLYILLRSTMSKMFIFGRFCLEAVMDLEKKKKGGRSPERILKGPKTVEVEIIY